MGVNEPELEVHDWTPGRFGTVLQFTAACDLAELPLEWNPEQIIAFLDMIDAKHYAMTTIDAFWGNLKRIGKALNKNVTKGQWMYFEAVWDNGKSTKDDRLPVSRELLIQLCARADKMLKGFNKKWAKAIFMSTFGFCMRLSEFADQKSYCCGLMLNYNLKSSCIRIADSDFSAAFESDKTSMKGNPVKHCTILWEDLPPGAKAIIENYDNSHPDSTWFFCKNDKWTLTRNEALNLLDLCLLQTNWRHLKITPHSFR